MEEVERVIAVADMMPFRYLIQHIGAGSDALTPQRTEAAFSSLERLRLLAKQAGAQLVVENTPHTLATPARLVEFLAATHLDDIGVCFDTGHAHLPGHLLGGGGVEAAWELLAGRTVTTHLHDNRGRKDDHLWPGEGCIPWAAWVPRLAQRREIPWVLEIGTHPDEAATFERLRRCWEQLESWGMG